ncbi:MAG: phosphoenolpyruvate--protein phosphotransferase [Kiloniellaceae bacterium]
MKTDRKTERGGKEEVLEGLGVAPGVAIGPAYVREARDLQVVEYQVPVAKVKAEKARLAEAVAKAVRQVGKLKAKAIGIHGLAAEDLGYLLEAHLQMLNSTRLIGGIERRIETDRRNAESAVMAEISAIAQEFAAMEDSYLSARADDVREVGHRLLRCLTDVEFHGFSGLERGSVVIAEEITPADTALMDPREVGGFACVLGGAEGHTAIMARSLGLPAVLGVPNLLPRVRAGDPLIVDGSNGLVIVNPTAARRAAYERRLKDMAREARALSRLRDVPACTRDGQRVNLHLNLELPRELDQVAESGAEGVGLLRTEFMYMNRSDLPDEEEQYRVLAEIVRALGGRPVTVRTLDIGGEKLASSLGDHLGEAVNPALGLRAIRLSLKEPKLLRPQLAAMLRAGVHGPLRILLPMITTPGEVRAVRKELDKTARRLTRRGVAIADPLPPVGVMIEVPGAALAADALAQAADFFAIGTNDLTMYTLAIDRGDERVAHLFNPLHPAVLRLIQFTVEAALRARIPVSVCGEIAGDPRFAALLVGLGVRELSMTAKAIPRVKNRLLSIDMHAAGRRAMMIMEQVDSGRIATLLDDFNEMAG